VDAIGWKRDIFYSPIAFIAFIGGVIGLSLLVHKYFEMPAQSFVRARASSSLAKLSVTVEDRGRA
jgi:peptidoglycan/LPS O-acetylase OafA/YrhL